MISFSLEGVRRGGVVEIDVDNNLQLSPILKSSHTPNTIAGEILSLLLICLPTFMVGSHLPEK